MLTLLASLACTKVDDPGTDEVTWTQDVQPLMAQHCLRCHTAGAMSPLTLDSYEQASVIAGAIAESVSERRMPPHIADNSGACQTYQDHGQWLEDDAIAAFVDWAEAGAPQGPEQEPVAAVQTQGLQDPSAVLAPPQPYAPDFSGGDDWRCFVLEVNPGTETRYLQAYEVIPERVERVHHVTLFKPINSQTADIARGLDDGGGYTCFGDAGVPGALVGVWSAGRRTFTYPEGTGVPIEPGIPVIMQIHYTPDGEDGLATTTRMAVQLEDQARPLYPLWLLNDNFTLQPDTPDQWDSESGTIREALNEFSLYDVQGELEVIGTAGHMHLLGSALHIDIEHESGGETCLLDIPRFDYNWHDVFLLETPVPVTDRDTIQMDCAWDTTGVDQTVSWGDGIDEEMCVALLLTSPRED